MKTWLCCAGALSTALSLMPAAVNDAHGATVLAIGDSITKGEGSYDTGGYRMYLDKLLGSGFDFIGKRNDTSDGQPYRGDWQNHNGYGGYQAASNGVPDRSILKRFKDDKIFSKIPAPDVILLHVGANTIGYADPRSSGENYAGSTSDKADAQLYRLLEYIGNAAPKAKIIVSQIVPKAKSERNLADTFKYNFGGSDGKGGIPAVLRKISSSISKRVTLANMFQINLKAVGRSDLIGNSKVDPDKDGIVDWVKNLDEFDFYDMFGFDGYNSNLLGDGLHPTKLGYELMAAEWYRALKAAGVVSSSASKKLAAGPGAGAGTRAGTVADVAMEASAVPTPTAAATGLALGGSLLLRRRRDA